jgi:hypothetical protein
MMTLLHLAVYINTLIQIFYYLQKFLNKQIDLITIGNNHKFTRSCQRLGLENVIHEPTRITSSSSTLFDPILVNNYDIVRDSYVYPEVEHVLSFLEYKYS